MNEKKDTFSTFHPVINFTFYIGALFLMLSFINPLFNTYGDRVLFTWWNGRPYTLEALAY